MLLYFNCRLTGVHAYLILFTYAASNGRLIAELHRNWEGRHRRLTWDNIALLIIKVNNSSVKCDLFKVLGRTNWLLYLIWHGPHWKRSVQQSFYCCVCIRYRGNISTEPLPNNDRGTSTEPLSSNDKGIFTEPLPSNDKGIHRQQRDLVSLVYFFFQNNKSRLKIWFCSVQFMVIIVSSVGPL
jgi:hypothetical protein